MAQPGHVTIHALRRHALIRDSALPFRDHGLEQCLSGSFQNRHRDGVKPSAMEISIPPGPKVPSLHLAFQFPSRDGEQIPVIPLRLAHIRLVDTAQERTGLPSVPVSSFRRTLVLSSCSGNCRTVVPAPVIQPDKPDWLPRRIRFTQQAAIFSSRSSQASPSFQEFISIVVA